MQSPLCGGRELQRLRKDGCVDRQMHAVLILREKLLSDEQGVLHTLETAMGSTSRLRGTCQVVFQVVLLKGRVHDMQLLILLKVASVHMGVLALSFLFKHWASL